LGKAISNLIEIVSYEDQRQMVNRRYSRRKDSFEDIFKSIEDISGLYPIEGMKLKSILTNYIFSKKMSLKESSKLGRNAYIQLLSIHEAALEIEQKELEKLIIKLAYKHSFSQWWKVRKYLNHSYSNTNQFTDSEVHKYLEELARKVNLKEEKNPDEKLGLEQMSKKEKV